MIIIDSVDNYCSIDNYYLTEKYCEVEKYCLAGIGFWVDNYCWVWIDNHYYSVELEVGARFHCYHHQTASQTN